MYHKLHRGQRNSRICPLIIYRSLHCTLTFAAPRQSSFTSLRHYSPLPPSSLASSGSCTPALSIPNSSQTCIPTCVPRALSDPSYRSNSDHVDMYCANVLCHRLIYYSIVINHASPLSDVDEVYLHLPSSFPFRSRPVRRLATSI